MLLLKYINNRRPCNTLRIGKNLDTKGYGIATPLNSPLTVELNLKILSLKESSELAKLEHKWWFERSECKSVDRNIVSAKAIVFLLRNRIRKIEYQSVEQ